MRFAISICALGLAVHPLGAAERSPADQMLAELDRVRQPARSYQADLAVAEFRQGKNEREGTFHLYARKTSRGFDLLALCLTPAADHNKLFLARDREFWFYDPRSARAVPISPSQFRSHQLVLDLISKPLASEYSAEIEGEESITDLAKRPFEALRLALTSRKRGPAAALRYWVEKESRRPIRSEALSSSGRAIRTIHYSDFKNQLNETRPTRLVVVTPAESSVIDLKLTNFTWSDAPASFFDETNLPATLTRLK